MKTDVAEGTAVLESLFPEDSKLLELRLGGLLVSRSHALFCGLTAGDRDLVESALEGDARVFPERLENELRRHGFGGPPREPKVESPSVQLQLTNGCNLRCAYCCTNSGEPRRREVTYGELCAVVDDVREVLGPGTRVAILGGEPLLVPWALDLAEHVLDRELCLTLFTNGVELAGDDDLARRVAMLQSRGAQVRVSLAGPTEESCDRISGAPRFRKVIDGIRAVSRHAGSVVVDLALLPGDVDEISRNLRDLRALLPPTTEIAFGVLYLSGREQGQHLFGARSELESALDRIAFEAGEVIVAPKTSPLVDRREGCSCALGHHLHVRSDGALFTCFKMEEEVGHLAERPFAEALRDRAERARPVSALAFCADCDLATICGGGCRSENYQFTGDPDVPICGPWRLQVLAELLAEDRVTAVKWPAPHLLAEARSRGIEGPEVLIPQVPSRHLVDV